MNIIIIDIETTGLSPTSDSILEIAAIPAQIYKQALTIDYTEAVSMVIGKDIEFLSKMNVKVREMHNKNGLSQEVISSKYTLRDAEGLVIDLINKSFGATTNLIQICGNSVHFDKSFIDKQMYILSKRLHYRILDMTTYRTLKTEVEGYTLPLIPKHRALDDCTYSASLLQEFYQSLCFNIKP